MLLSNFRLSVQCTNSGVLWHAHSCDGVFLKISFARVSSLLQISSRYFARGVPRARGFVHQFFFVAVSPGQPLATGVLSRENLQI